MNQSLYVLDGHYQIYRAYYAPFAPLTSPTGEPTKAVHAFCGMLFSLIRERKPDFLAMAMDISDETVFRRDIDPQYKANRQPPPEDFAPQKERIVAIVQAMNIPIIKVPTFEADDVMATIADQLADRDIDTYLVSVDKDLEQLITPKVHLYDAAKNLVVDIAALAQKKGYTPQQAVEIQTLCGDSVDNVPGVTGVGIKTATKLINQYGSADSVLDNAQHLTPKLRERITAFASRIDTTRRLVTLRRDTPIQFDLDACRLNTLDVERVRPIFEELALTRLTQQLDVIGESLSGDTAQAVQAKPDAPSDAHDYQLIDSLEKLDDFAAQLAKQPRFAFDTETTGLNALADKLVGISISWQANTGFYLPIRAAMGNTLPLDTAIQKLKPIFDNADIEKCAHNLKFDLLVLHNVGINTQGARFDTMLASFVDQPLRTSHGLKQLSREVLGIEMTPITDLIGKGKNQTTIDQVDAARVCEYAAADADCTWQLFEYFQPRITAGPSRSLFEDVEMPLVEVLTEMERHGVAIDTELLADMSADFATRLQSLTQRIHTEAGYAFNIDSTKQLANLLFDERNLTVVRKTKTGRSTDADTLATLAATTNDPIPPLVLEYRELAKLKSTYVDTLPEMINPATHRIHTSFHQTGAVTGRLSSSNPNLQNIPIRTEEGRRIRRAFVAGDPDQLLLVADYSQIELRILAHFSQDRALTTAFQQDQDIHTYVAAQINGVDIDQVTKEQRSAAKAVNFGIIYGQTPFGLARSLDIPPAQAKAFIDTYFMRYPGIRMFIDQCIRDAKKCGYVETLLGRRRPVEELRSRNRQQVAFGERIAVNTVIQGTAADLIKKAMIDIHQALQGDKYNARMIIQVHDELVFEVAKTHADELVNLVREKMCNAIPLSIPIAVDINHGPNWLDAK